MLSLFQRNRHDNIYSNIFITHLACMFILLASIFKTFNLTAVDAHIFVKYILFFALFFLIESALVYFLKKDELQFNKHYLTFLNIVFISFPLAASIIVLFVNKENAYDVKVVLLIPVLIAGSIMGKKVSYFLSLINTGLIIFYDSYRIGSFDIVQIIESNLIIISLMFLIGWFSGAISELEKESREELTNLANTDNLTQLFNHRYLQERLRVLFKGADDENPLSLIMIDIDDFKLFNDTHGHQKGDDLLVQIGQIITNSAPQSGFAARYGGEEFVVVLPGLNSTKTVNLAENIRHKIDTNIFYGEEHQPAGKLTVSCGVATAPEYAKTPEELIQRADQALYRAKSLSKNRVELYSSVFEELLKTARGEEKNLINSFQTLLQVINAKDRYTYGHSERVMEYSVKLAGEINLPDSDITLLRYAAFLHDIGKIEIDRNLLNKADILNDREFNTIQQHCRWGSEIVKAVPLLDKTTSIILHHHENYNGSGYPHGLSGENIPLLARIIRVADSYDAMTSNRPYRKAMSNDEALEEIKRCSGTMFDPKLVPHFLNIMPRTAQYAGSGS